jgi:hypothetical protein
MFQCTLAVRYVLELRRASCGWAGNMHPRLVVAVVIVTMVILVAFNRLWKVINQVQDPCISFNRRAGSLQKIKQTSCSPNRRAMSYYPRLGPYMDPNVFRSTSHLAHHVDPDVVIPRYIATDTSRSLRHDDYFRASRDKHFESPQLAQSYRSDRRYPNYYSTSGPDIVSLVRKYAITTSQHLDVS